MNHDIWLYKTDEDARLCRNGKKKTISSAGDTLPEGYSVMTDDAKPSGFFSVETATIATYRRVDFWYKRRPDYDGELYALRMLAAISGGPPPEEKKPILIRSAYVLSSEKPYRSGISEIRCTGKITVV